jgi:hypothetical protein
MNRTEFGPSDAQPRSYAAVHRDLRADAWLVGRAIMAELAEWEVRPAAGGPPLSARELARARGGG